MQRSEGRIRSAARNSLLPLTIALACLSPAIGATHKTTGLVVSIDRTAGVILVSHREIPGVMPAMSMPLRVDRLTDLRGVEPGARIRFDLVLGAGKSRARNVRIEKPAPEDFTPPAAPNKLVVGAEVPDFELTTHNGRAFRLSLARGRPVAIQFIYSRCPLADVCPRQVSQFAYVNRKLAGKVTLLSVTLDPTHDTADELSRYAARWRPTEDWMFLTGSESAVEAVAGRFGVVFWPEDGAISHTSSTALIDAQGRLRAIIDGSSHTAAQLLDLIGNHLR